MKLKSKNILLISPEPWDHIFVSKHRYATHLAKRGNRVFFLNPPSRNEKIGKTDFENLFSVQYNGFSKGLRFMPSFIQKHLIRNKFKQLQDICKVKFDVVWSFDNSVFFDFSALPDETYCISHIVDLNQDFEFEKAAKTANLCLGVCRPILNKLKVYNKNSFFINHGFKDFEHSHHLSKVKRPGKQKIKAFYAGNLNIKYLDWNLLESCIERFTQVDFVLAGPWNDSELKDRLLVKSNVHYIGTVNSNELSKYYKSSDILLITYKYSEFPDQLSNSHKMMEYLGSGTMILATWTQEFKQLNEQHYFKMTKSLQGFLANFEEIILHLSEWNDDKKRAYRRNYALDNTYEKQIERIINLLNN